MKNIVIFFTFMRFALFSLLTSFTLISIVTKKNIKHMRLHVLDVEMCRYLSEVFLDGCFEVVAVFDSLHDFAVLDDECCGNTSHSVGTHDG